MIKSLFTVIVLATFLSIPFANAEEKIKPTTLKLASTLWCPYICDKEPQQGFIVDYMERLLENHGIDLKVTVLPWSRAIAMARAGEFDGLLTAVKSEAPDFHFTEEPSGRYQMCFYSKQDSAIKYEDRSSLQSRMLGGIKNYGYGHPIDDVIANPQKGEKVYLISNSKPLELLTGMLSFGRIDLFIEDRMVVNHAIKSRPELSEVRLAGCLEEVPFYTAISPAFPESNYWLELLNKALRTKTAKTFYLEAMNKYILN